MQMIIGGAFQNKLEYAKTVYGTIDWVDGAFCTEEALYQCEGVFHFERFIKKQLEEGKELEALAEQLIQNNPGIMIVCDEVGYGLVPMEKADRIYRETTGRICTKLAAFSEKVERIVCGIPMTIKGEA